MIEKERITYLNQKPVQNKQYVLYWMQASQRTENNHALEYAIKHANGYKKPLVVFFGITDNFPEANLRHYIFMLQGLKEVEDELKQRGIGMIIRYGSPEKEVLKLAERADLVVVDRGYLRIQRQWREYAAEYADCLFIQVESEVIVPIELVSSKEEYSARTIRSKIHKYRDDFLNYLPQQESNYPSVNLDIETIDISSLDTIQSQLQVDQTVAPITHFRGGSQAAAEQLDDFIHNKLDQFPELRNHPELDLVSHQSPYLHFGQISPLTIVFRVLERQSPGEEAFLEELIVRRELSMNFVFYNPFYDSYDAIPPWAQDTLTDHKDDPREYLYTREELENANTHDEYWNAAQREMVFRGKMHGYMRMYWGKKILEWSPTPEDAFQRTLFLNNKYELDGRDPNGFTGVAWCFGKHDRAWQERPIFGKIRYMNANGLKRKFDIDRYVKRVEKIVKDSKSNRNSGSLSELESDLKS